MPNELWTQGELSRLTLELLTYLQTTQSGNLNGVQVTMTPYNAISVAVQGTFTGTVNFETSFDGGTVWLAAPLQKQDGSWVTTATAPGVFSNDMVAWPTFRARTSAMSAGSVTVILSARV